MPRVNAIRIVGGSSDEFGAIKNRTPADGQQEGNVLFTGDVDCVHQRFIRRVRLNAAKFAHVQAFQRLLDLRQYARFFHAAAAVGDQHACVLWDLCAQFSDCAFTKQNAGRGMQIKVIHCSFPYVGKKRGQEGLPDGEHCGRARLSSQCSFLPMSCPFLQGAGEKR